MRQTLLLSACVACAACAEDIAPAGGPDGGTTEDAAPVLPVSTTPQDDGSFLTRLDATSSAGWRRLDLETGEEAADTAGWDLAGQRSHLQLNGGVSGEAGVRVAPLVDVEFADVTEAPTDGWITDEPDGDDPNGDPDYAFEQGDRWYSYDPATHVLTARPTVWVVETTEGAHVKLAIESYYDEVGTAAVYRLRWATL